jgi:microcystin-dependent protein
MRRSKPQRGFTVLEGNPALAAWPVGSVFIGYTSTSPATLLGGGSWTQFGQGRMLVGQNSADTDFDVVGDTGGSKTKSIGLNNIPQHAHGIGHDHGNATKSVQYAQTTSTGGTAYRVTDIGGVVGGGGTSVTLSINVPSFSGNSFNQASTETPLDVMNPFIVVYFWRRTA